MDEMFTAEKSHGAYLNDKRLRVAARMLLNESLIATGIPFRGRGGHERFLEELPPIMASTSGVIAPPMCTSTTPAVSSPSAASTVPAERASVSGATSAKRGLPPAWITAAAVAKNVFAGTTTSRPGR